MRKIFLGLLGAAIVVGSVSLLTRSPRATKSVVVERHAAYVAATAPTLPSQRHIDDHVHAALVDYAKRPATTIALETGEQGKTAVRAFVSRSINLDAASQRQSTRFDRTSYTSPAARDVPMHLGDRPGITDEASTGTVAVVYREGKTAMSFQKLDKDKQTPTGAGLPEHEATEQARSFMIANGIIGESKTDVIARVQVRERRVNQEDASDFLAQQDIVLQRTVDGKPVINSSASVSVLPNTEIVGLKVSNWIPTTSDRTQIKSTSDDAAARVLATNIEAQLADVLAQELGSDAQGAIVRDVEESWFSSDRDGLIPALVFVVELRNDGHPYTVAVAMTPYHDSAQIWQQGRKTSVASVEPSISQ
jgi:hypothetical protein